MYCLLFFYGRLKKTKKKKRKYLCKKIVKWSISILSAEIASAALARVCYTSVFVRSCHHTHTLSLSLFLSFFFCVWCFFSIFRFGFNEKKEFQVHIICNFIEHENNAKKKHNGIMNREKFIMCVCVWRFEHTKQV